MSKGHRVRGACSGFVFGLGVAILLQQFGVVALTLPVVLALPLGMLLVGIAIGWPRRPRAAAPAAAATPT
jgi:hypothetical protein